MHSFTHSFIQSVIHSFTHSPIHSVSHSFIHAFIHLASLRQLCGRAAHCFENSTFNCPQHPFFNGFQLRISSTTTVDACAAAREWQAVTWTREIKSFEETHNAHNARCKCLPSISTILDLPI